jgi:hypothetical protein
LAREDRPLNMGEKISLRTHMFICKACPGFEDQILTMRNAMQQWRNYTGDEDGAKTPHTSSDTAADKPLK